MISPARAQPIVLILLLALWVGLCLTAATSFAGSLEETFAQGNALYEQGDYAAAAERYKTILRYGLENSLVHFNLGNAFFKLGRPGPAILHYERALRLAPGDEDARTNLAYCRRRLVDRVEGAEENIYGHFLRRFRDLWTLDQAALLFLGGYYLLSGALLQRILRSGERRSAASRLGRYLALFALLVMLAAGSQYLLRSRHLALREGAVVIARQANVVSAPGPEHKLITSVHEGLQVRVLEEKEGWLRVEIPGAGIGGWVPAGDVERI